MLIPWVRLCPISAMDKAPQILLPKAVKVANPKNEEEMFEAGNSHKMLNPSKSTKNMKKKLNLMKFGRIFVIVTCNIFIYWKKKIQFFLPTKVVLDDGITEWMSLTGPAMCDDRCPPRSVGTMCPKRGQSTKPRPGYVGNISLKGTGSSREVPHNFE